MAEEKKLFKVSGNRELREMQRKMLGENVLLLLTDLSRQLSRDNSTLERLQACKLRTRTM